MNKITDRKVFDAFSGEEVKKPSQTAQMHTTNMSKASLQSNIKISTNKGEWACEYLEEGSVIPERVRGLYKANTGSDSTRLPKNKGMWIVDFVRNKHALTAHDGLPAVQLLLPGNWGNTMVFQWIDSLDRAMI